MQKTCAGCTLDFEIDKQDLDFLAKISPKFAGKTIPIPPPRLCPECRKRRRLCFRNDFTLYNRTSSLSGKPMLSIYPANSSFPVYNHAEWWGDSWDATAYGIEYDFSRGFFEQFAALRERVPRINLYVDSSCENCDFSNQLTMSRDCYLVFSGSSNEHCLYGYRFNNSRFCYDCLYAIGCELCHECVDVLGCYDLKFSQIATNCRESSFLFDCQNCSHCHFCVGLRNASYCLRNKQYNKIEYEKLLAQISFASRQQTEALRSDFEQYKLRFPQLYAYFRNVEDVNGDNIQNAKDCRWAFDGANLEDVHYAQFVQDSKHCMDINFGCDQTLWNYEVCTTGINAYNILFSIDTWPNASDLIYCDSCLSGCKNCFGSIGLRAKQYCVLNKQYSKDEYEKLVPRIIAQMQREASWGEFFPPYASPFGYNESTAFEFFPLPKSEAKKLGFNWQENMPASPSTIDIQAPDNTSALKHDCSGQVYQCTGCSKGYKLIGPEIDYYIRQQIAAPVLCPACRREARMNLRNPRRLWSRNCSACAKELLSSYSPNRPEKILCEPCYFKHAY